MARLITFEGIEGSGKTTQLKILAERLRNEGHEVIVTREPGGCDIADQIRAILLDAANHAMAPLSELLLYAAARAQHVEQVIRPALAAGKIVLCDRFTDATFAYQGHGRQLDRQLIETLNLIATSGIKPDLTLLIDCPVTTGLGRAMARINAGSGAREERFELEAMSFHERVRDGYLELARREPSRFIIVDGDRSIEATADDVASRVIAALSGD